MLSLSRSVSIINLFIFIAVLFCATTAHAQDSANFVPLVGIPYLDSEGATTFGDYVNAFYYAAISIAAFLAVVRIIFAGVKYMLTDVVTQKGDARKDIRAALIGLLIVIGAVLILNTVNTNLTTINLFDDAPEINLGTSDTRRGVPQPPNPTIGSSINTCEHTSSYVNGYIKGCPGDITAERSGGVGCFTLSCQSPIVYEGPETCPAGETLTIDSSSDPIVRSCVPDEPAPVEPGVTILERTITIPCAIAISCNHPNDTGYQAGIASAEETCSQLGDMIEFRVTGNGEGVCYYTQP